MSGSFADAEFEDLDLLIEALIRRFSREEVTDYIEAYVDDDDDDQGDNWND